ncbi:3-isopropylmalate dehydratase small subunit [Dissulfurirhabdus thermomarina]|uniref:3-isopropylmalate dehydratase small subunit n=1 Tax=Dissulfurirhabdus thermomarina TaxID=1765737 RepID=A0A6N9TV10_DISTH|nr:3-isopropylmalate dehydratase small subunit [Dissulfurirhabdus thermomarina]NDY43574.1 3-isopropylmalate dehydratase small subunit [Dissulfurirhabdus thermomarina]NMX23001.1 3-isopropylmalate dehydratase small subunit [Dissulfurirhabdus thermomarina]
MSGPVTVPVFVLGDDVSTDLLHPPDYFSLDPARIREGFLRGVSEEWSRRVPPGAVIVAGRNLGCGSSREVTAQVFRERGVRLVLARSFARIFHRNLVNLGIPHRSVEGAVPWPPGTELEAVLDLEGRRLFATGGPALRFAPPSPFADRVAAAGGLLGLLEPGEKRGAPPA